MLTQNMSPTHVPSAGATLFAYDGLGRLNRGLYVPSGSTDPWAVTSYDLRDVDYDANGNLLGLTRWLPANVGDLDNDGNQRTGRLGG